MRVFLTFTSVNEHVLLALGSDHTGRDDVEICQVVGGWSVHMFPQVSLCEALQD